MTGNKLGDKPEFMELRFTGRISKQGNALLVRIPKSLRDAFHIEPGTPVYVIIKKITGGVKQ